MTDDTNFTGINRGDATDTNFTITYTQIASCAIGDRDLQASRLSLRAKLERERLERERHTQQSFITTLRNLFCPTR